MAEPTFAQQQVTEELSESDRIRKRIADFKSSINPNVLGVISLMIDNQLKSGMLKPGDLDAIVALRDEINKAQTEYTTQVNNAQRRLTELTQQEQAELVAKQEAAVQAIRDETTAERQRRKKAEERLGQMEAVLLSHGISMDLNADGKIGLAPGQQQVQLTQEEQDAIDDIVKVEKENIAQAPVEPKEPSRAFQMARALNPAEEALEEVNEKFEETLESLDDTPISEDEEFLQKVEETKEAFKPFKDVPEMTKEVPEMPEPEGFKPSGTTTESFLDEVERVNEVAEADEQISDEDYEPVRKELAEGVYIEEREVPEPSAPVITNSQRPEEPSLDIGYDEEKQTIPTYGSEEEMLAAAQEKLDNATEEEEYEEVTIPSESELKSMTKKDILEQANMLDFKLDIKDTKAVMIASFLTQVDEFIASLQESGEFVSASDEDESDDKSNIQDGGYF